MNSIKNTDILKRRINMDLMDTIPENNIIKTAIKLITLKKYLSIINFIPFSFKLLYLAVSSNC